MRRLTEMRPPQVQHSEAAGTVQRDFDNAPFDGASISEGPSWPTGLTVGISSLALAACGEGGSGPQPVTTLVGPSPTPTPSPSSTQSTSEFTLEDKAAARFLLRAGFTASVASVASVRSEGQVAWLHRQMRAANDQTAKEFFEERGYDEVTRNREFKFDRLTDEMIWDQLLRGGNSVRKRIALALSEFFVVSANRLNVVWPSQAVGAFWDLLNENAFANFKTLLREVTLSPAMGAFLDTIGNKKADPSTGRLPDENFAREVMQLFTIGLYELEIDGTLRTQSDRPIETYTNSDVEGLAHVFTGFDLDASGLQSFLDPVRPVDVIFEPEIVRRPLTPIPTKWQNPSQSRQHSLEEKRFLGSAIPAGTGPIESVELAIDTLFRHANVGPFFCKQMIQRLVTSNPRPEYVARVATVFNDNGKGVRGDLKAVFTSILTDEEANAPLGLDDYRFGKLREPAVRFVQFGRTFGLAKSGEQGITRDLSDGERLLGQVPLRSPSVFNFFRPEYVPPQSVTQANDMLGPEFQLVNEISVAGYINFMSRSISGETYWLNGFAPDYSDYLDMAHQPTRLLDRLDLELTAGQLRPFTREIILDAVNSLAVEESSREDLKKQTVQIIVMLIMASTDYLVQK